VDNYGDLSLKLPELVEQLASRNIKTDVRNYAGDDQYMGGWVDVHGQYTNKHYSTEDLQKLFTACENRYNCKVVWDGKLYSCINQGSGVLLGKVPDTRRDYIDLFSEESLEFKRGLVAQMGQQPFEACKYCYGYGVVNNRRIPAAIQL
jgi:hypothetical protein